MVLVFMVPRGRSIGYSSIEERVLKVNTIYHSVTVLAQHEQLRLLTSHPEFFFLFFVLLICLSIYIYTYF